MTTLQWRATNATLTSIRTDDIWFNDPNTGWLVNLNGEISKTTDGGHSWVRQYLASPKTYLRCIAFANASIGWVGTFSQEQLLLQTRDGGAHWSVVSDLPANAPVKVCGMSVVSDQVVYCSGTNFLGECPRMMKTGDGGATWIAWDMSAYTSTLIDCYFTDALHGWVVGGKINQSNSTSRDMLKPVVLETTDGGLTWTNRLAGQEARFPFGEWGWKIQFLNSQIGFVSLENYSQGAILKTSDGGQTWHRLKINDPQGNADLEGIGFVDEHHGWVGGWGPRSPNLPVIKGYSSETSNGGLDWKDANYVGQNINRFRFFGNPVTVGYASGFTVYKYSSEPITMPAIAPIGVAPSQPTLPERQIVGRPGNVPIRFNVPEGTKRLTINIWDRFGNEVGCVLDEIRPVTGARQFIWDGANWRGASTPPGDYFMRLTSDDEATSSLLHLESTQIAAP